MVRNTLKHKNNHRISQVGKDTKESSSPTPVPAQTPQNPTLCIPGGVVQTHLGALAALGVSLFPGEPEQCPAPSGGRT